MSKRTYGDGSVYPDKKRGGWIAAVPFGYDDDGKRDRVRRRAATKSEAEALRRELLRQRDNGLPPGRANVTVGQLLDFFVDTVVESADPSPNTIDNYRWAIDNHLGPGLGRKRILSLTTEDIEHFLIRRRDDRHLARTSLARLKSVLVQALREAQRRDWVQRNVAEIARVPTAPTKKRRSLTPEEATALLRGAEGSRFEAAILVGLSRGLRPGELLGLKWEDLELDGDPPVVHIRRSLKRERNQLRLGDTKTPKSRRDLVLPDAAVTALRRHRARQNQERLASGDAWQDHGLVFATQRGTPVDPANFRNQFKKLTRAAGLGNRPPYELRHSAVSLLSAAGVPIEQLADLAGHTDARTLMQVYRHQINPAVDAGADIASTLFDPSRRADAT